MQVGPINIRSRMKGGPEPVKVDGGLRLLAEVQWRLKGPARTIAEIEKALHGFVERVDDDLLFLHFGNSVGFFEVPYLERVESYSGKWTVDHFNRMLRDLTQVAAELPFAASEGSALPYDRNVPVAREILYHAFVYVRHAVLNAEGDENLCRAYGLVLADPHRRLVREDHWTAPELARSVGPKALEELVSGRVRLHKAPAGCEAPVAIALRGHLPEQVREDVAYRRLDCPENRFAKALLGQLLWIVDRVHERVDDAEGGLSERIADDCRKIRAKLEPIVRNSLWKGIGPLVAIPEASTVLHRRRGYRELFGHFSALRLASKVPLSARDVTRLLEAKDIATLYELWCFFQVVQAVMAVEGRPKSADAVSFTEWDAKVRHGYRVLWPSGIAAAYNPSFTPTRVRRKSYSVALRPDISLRVPPNRANSGLHLLDAKFKLDNLGELLGTDLEEDPDALGHSGFKRGDLYKMHTYRDAIPDARSVWILYPGAEFCFFDARLQPKCYDLAALAAPADGVGAVPLRPEDDGAGSLEQLITKLLAVG